MCTLNIFNKQVKVESIRFIYLYILMELMVKRDGMEPQNGYQQVQTVKQF